MAISFREYPWYLQALVFIALALIIIGAGEYLPVSPVAAMRSTVAGKSHEGFGPESSGGGIAGLRAPQCGIQT